MANITSGRVVFSRTVKTGDYENKKAEVELTFTVADDGEHEPLLALAARQAMTKAHEMLGLQSEGAVRGGKAKTPDDMKDFAGKSLEEQQATATAKKAAKKPAKAKEPDPEPEAEAEEAEEWEKDEPEAEEAETIEDEALVEKISAHARATGNKKAIKELIAKFSPKTGKADGIPADKRANFLGALKKIGKPAAE